MDRKAVAKSVLSSAPRFRILNEGNKSTWNHNEEHMQCVCEWSNRHPKFFFGCELISHSKSSQTMSNHDGVLVNDIRVHDP